MKIKCFTVNPFQENTYLLYDDTKDCVLVDPGFFTPQEKEYVKAFINDNKLTLKATWLTHAHIDHIMGLTFIEKEFGVPFYMHLKEKEVLYQMSPTASQMYGIPLTLPINAPNYIKEGEPMSFGDTTLDVLFTPGHAPGHVVFVHHESGAVINGDVLFRGSVGRTDFPNSNHQDLINSIQQKLFKLPEHYVVYTGHGEPTTIGEEKRSNPFVGVVS